MAAIGTKITDRAQAAALLGARLMEAYEVARGKGHMAAFQFDDVAGEIQVYVIADPELTAKFETVIAANCEIRVMEGQAR